MRGDEASAWNNLGLSYFENEQFDEALSAYGTAIQKETTAVDEKNVNPEHLSFYFKNRGLAYYHLGEMVEAKHDYDEAIKLNQENADNYFNRGNVYLNQSDFKKAHKDFDKAINLENNNAKFHHAKGLAFQAQAEEFARSQEFAFEEEEEMINRAIAFFGQALLLSPEFISPMFHQGLMYRRTNRFHEALKQFSKVEALLPGDKTVYIQRGLVY